MAYNYEIAVKEKTAFDVGRKEGRNSLPIHISNNWTLGEITSYWNGYRVGQKEVSEQLDTSMEYGD